MSDCVFSQKSVFLAQQSVRNIKFKILAILNYMSG
uniref:Uncharacterized protein n=1 Tax=Lepeophtheirus salmonis TaxID=72036 RepID=A0A0K2TRA1_LEPSM